MLIVYVPQQCPLSSLPFHNYHLPQLLSPFCCSHIQHGSFPLLEQGAVPANKQKQPGSGWFLESTVTAHVQYDRLQMRLIKHSLYSSSCPVKIHNI